MSAPQHEPSLEQMASWEPHDDHVRQDQRAALDALREHCPVAWSEAAGWSVFRHAEITRVLADPVTFSNAVSRHRSVPNGMDPPQHDAFRRVIEPYFAPARMRAFEPACRAIARRLVDAAVAAGTSECMLQLAGPYAAEAQCAFLGWPESVATTLQAWTRANQQAIRDGDRERLAALAHEFGEVVEAQLDARRASEPGADLTAALMHERVEGRPLTAKELVSILRNWTAGEVATLSASVGILVQYLATHPQLQQTLRGDPRLVAAAIEEILRLEGPLPSNRRVTTRSVDIGGQRLEAGERVSLMWIPATRDPAAFADPAEFRLDRDRSASLLWGQGIHVCPGAPLARLELRVVLEELLAATARIEPLPERPFERAVWPAAGFQRVPVRLVEVDAAETA